MFKLSFSYFYVIRVRDKIISLIFEDYKYITGEKCFQLANRLNNERNKMKRSNVRQVECQAEVLNSWVGNRVSGESPVAGVI